MRLRIRVSKRTTTERFLLSMALFCISSFALLEHVSISVPMFSSLKMPLLYLGGIFLLTKLLFILKQLRKKRLFSVFSVVLIMSVLLLFSAQFNKNPVIGESPISDTNRLILYLLELFLLMIWVSQTQSSQFVLKFLFRYVLILAIVTDILLFTKLLTFSDGHFETYLIGTKFSVCYLHMNLLTLWYCLKQNFSYQDRTTKRIIWLGIPFITLVSIYVDCVTGILGCLMLLVLFWLLNTKLQKKLIKFCSPVTMSLFLLASVIFPFVAEQVLSTPAIAYIIEDVFGRDVTLTGRLNIFEIFGDRMQGHWMWGFGWGNGNAVSVALFGYENSQNALLQWFLQAGVPAALLFVTLMLLIMRQHHKSANRLRNMPFVLLIYIYIVLGTIETTYSMSFLMWFAVIFMLTNEKKPVVTEPITQ